MQRVRRIARWARFVLATLFLVGIVVQFVAAGYGMFADRGNFGLHEGLGWTVMHVLPILILVAGLLIWRPVSELGLSIAIGVLGAIQPTLPAAGDWAGAFHPLNALVLFFLAHRLTDRDWALLRGAESRAATAPPAEPVRRT